jgi:hypothetical protein
MVIVINCTTAEEVINIVKYLYKINVNWRMKLVIYNHKLGRKGVEP